MKKPFLTIHNIATRLINKQPLNMAEALLTFLFLSAIGISISLVFGTESFKTQP